MIRPTPPIRYVDPSSLSLGKIPPQELIIKDSIGQKIEKLCGSSEWQPRMLYITNQFVLITHPDQDEISDQIPLVNCMCLIYPNFL